MKSITESVKQALIETLNLDSNHGIENHSKLKEDLGLDSMSSLTFLMKLEESIENFTVDADTLEMDDLKTVETISDYVLSQIKLDGEENIFGEIAYA